MQLKKLLENLEYTCVKGSLDKEVKDVIYDSRQVTLDTLFVCIKGTVRDSHDFAEEVVNKGAVVLVVEREVDVLDDVTVIKVNDARLALAVLSSAYFNHPAKELKVIGITGTKGKTTTTYMIRSVLMKAGLKVGLIGTIETIIGDEHIPAQNTTPESYLLQKYLRQMADQGCQCVVMEVSSQGLMMNRVAGFEFDYGIFTNIEPDHIGPNEHKDFSEYLLCKSMLFKQCKVGIVNIDDPHVLEIIKEHTCEIETFGLMEKADLFADNIKYITKDGILCIEYDLKGKLDFHITVNVPGKFSVYNSLTAISICSHFNIPIETIKSALSAVLVKGRIEMIPVSDKYTLLIDYAHNAMSLESLLTTLKEYNPKRLVCMFGCGGNRSKIRRFEMGEISGKLSDLTVITSDNPRNEQPEDIIEDIKTGIIKTSGKFVEICDRKEAIKYCIENALEGDIIVFAGKGHEDYQEIKGVKYPMDEREIIKEITGVRW